MTQTPPKSPKEKTNKQCMVDGCEEKTNCYVFDGNFWIRVCLKHWQEFKDFARDNKLEFDYAQICLYCGVGRCDNYSDACNNCKEKAERLGCDVSDLTKSTEEQT